MGCSGGKAELRDLESHPKDEAQVTTYVGRNSRNSTQEDGL